MHVHEEMWETSSKVLQETIWERSEVSFNVVREILVMVFLGNKTKPLEYV